MQVCDVHAALVVQVSYESEQGTRTAQLSEQYWTESDQQQPPTLSDVGQRGEGGVRLLAWT